MDIKAEDGKKPEKRLMELSRKRKRQDNSLYLAFSLWQELKEGLKGFRANGKDNGKANRKANGKAECSSLALVALFPDVKSYVTSVPFKVATKETRGLARLCQPTVK